MELPGLALLSRCSVWMQCCSEFSETAAVAALPVAYILHHLARNAGNTT